MIPMLNPTPTLMYQRNIGLVHGTFRWGRQLRKWFISGLMYLEAQHKRRNQKISSNNFPGMFLPPFLPGKKNRFLGEAKRRSLQVSLDAGLYVRTKVRFSVKFPDSRRLRHVHNELSRTVSVSGHFPICGIFFRFWQISKWKRTSLTVVGF